MDPVLEDVLVELLVGPAGRVVRVNCGQPGKLGRTEGYTSHATLENAQDYAKGRVNSGHAREWCHCQKCLRGTLPRHSGRR